MANNINEFLKPANKNQTKYYDYNIWMRTCGQEINQPINGIVKGAIPIWLNGSLLRNGPGDLNVSSTEYKHIFDSAALLHRFGIKDGHVTYQCKFLNSQSYRQSKAANRIVLTEFGTAKTPDPCQSIFSKLSAVFTPGEGYTDNANVSLIPIADEYYAITDSSVVHKINPATLETKLRVNLFNELKIVAHTAHPIISRDGTVYNLGTQITAHGPFYAIYRFPTYIQNLCEAELVSKVPVSRKFNPGYMHSFGKTKNYFVLIEQPMSISVKSMIKMRFTTDPFATCLKWNTKLKSRISVTDCITGKLKYTFYTDAFFYMHIINTYEINNHIVLDVCSYKDGSILNQLYVESMRAAEYTNQRYDFIQAKALRFVFPLIKNVKETISNKSLVTLPSSNATAFKYRRNSIICHPELLTTIPCEFPWVSNKHFGKYYQYFYAIGGQVNNRIPGRLLKIDVINKREHMWCEPNAYPSEPIFVPHPDQQYEDDGVVLSVLVYGNEMVNLVTLLVLCAKSWQEIGRCIFRTPSPVPPSFHGWFKNDVDGNKT